MRSTTVAAPARNFGAWTGPMQRRISLRKDTTVGSADGIVTISASAAVGFWTAKGETPDTRSAVADRCLPQSSEEAGPRSGRLASVTHGLPPAPFFPGLPFLDQAPAPLAPPRGRFLVFFASSIAGNPVAGGSLGAAAREAAESTFDCKVRTKDHVDSMRDARSAGRTVRSMDPAALPAWAGAPVEEDDGV